MSSLLRAACASRAVASMPVRRITSTSAATIGRAGARAQARAPHTIRSAALTGSTTQITLRGCNVQVQWNRGFAFWNKKTEAASTEVEATAAASASDKTVRPMAGPAPAPLPAVPAARSTTTVAPSLYSASDRGGASKTDRLGFGSLVEAFNSMSFSWTRFKTYMVWIAVGGGVLMVFKVGLNIVDFFANVSFLDVGEVAFVGGLVTGLGVAVCAVLGTRFLRLRPEPIFQHALKRLSSDATVTQYMGSTLTSSEFRAYNFLDGGIRGVNSVAASTSRRPQTGLYKYYQPKRLQVSALHPHPLPTVRERSLKLLRCCCPRSDSVPCAVLVCSLLTACSK